MNYKPTKENEWMFKIAQGMALIREGCEGNEEWSNCKYCPFDEYCPIGFAGDIHDTIGSALEDFNKKVLAEA